MPLLIKQELEKNEIRLNFKGFQKLNGVFMLYRKEILFQFKGDRKYVQGADIFDSTLEVVKDFFGEYPNLLKGSFYRLLANAGIFSLYEGNELINLKNIYAQFLIQIRQLKYKIIVTASEKNIDSFKEFNENKVLEGFDIKGKLAMMSTKQSFSYMEQIVAITKRLHHVIYPNVSGKWLFTKIDLEDIINPSLFHNHRIVIEAKKNFHNKLTKNAIYLDDKQAGHIYYSLQI